MEVRLRRVVNPVSLVIVDDLCLHLFEFAPYQIRKELPNVFILRVRHMGSVIPDKAVLLLAVHVSAVMRIRLVDAAAVGTQIMGDGEPADTSS
jgi:hypothetical protein